MRGPRYAHGRERNGMRAPVLFGFDVDPTWAQPGEPERIARR
ncbi:hypothetical protein ABZ590_27000 [Streptomyces hirsutus]